MTESVLNISCRFVSECLDRLMTSRDFAFVFHIFFGWRYSSTCPNLSYILNLSIKSRRILDSLPFTVLWTALYEGTLTVSYWVSFSNKSWAAINTGETSPLLDSNYDLFLEFSQFWGHGFDYQSQHWIRHALWDNIRITSTAMLQAAQVLTR